jgi:hypothetical protein
MKRPKICCVCGADAGSWHQHWNRDNGYGVCVPCVAWLKERNTSDDEIRLNYGKEGANYGVRS